MQQRSLYLDQILQKFEPVIHYTARRVGIFPSFRDYEDFIQEGRIVMITSLKDFNGNPLKENAQFTAYMKNKLKWRFIDILRHRTISTCEPDEETVLAYVERKGQISPQEDSNHFILSWLKLAKEELTEKDYDLACLLIQGYKMTEIAKKRGVSKQAIFLQKQKLKERISNNPKLRIQEA